MALVSRSVPRGGTGRRWLLIGIVVTLFVLFISASLNSRSPGQQNQLATGAWVDRALPIVTASTEEGQQLAAIWSNGLNMPVPSLTAQLNQIASGAASAYRQASALRPPDSLTGAAGLLDASLLSRSDAAEEVRNALMPVLIANRSTDGPSGAAEVQGIQTAGQDLQVGDQSYRLFLRSLPNIGVTMPNSAWAANPSPYQPGPAQSFLTSLQSATSATPAHQVRIDAVTTSPSLVGISGAVRVLPYAPALSVTVVLSDTGSQPEKDLTVTAAIAPGAGSSSVRDFVNLTPGQAQTVQGMGPLVPPAGVDVRLTVTVTPPAGSPTAPVSQTLLFTMPATTSASSPTSG